MSANALQLAGRESELEALARALERVDGGEAVLVEVVGEPGIGKTRLLAELADLARRRGRLVLAGRATEFERDAPYGLWVDALDDHLRSLDARLLAGGELAALAVALPAFADVLAAPVPPAERYVVHRAMRALLERLATPRPLALCLDDLHWADPASLDLVAALARRPPDGAVLLAAAYREGQAPDTLVAALGDAARAARAERLAPAPLSQTEAAAMCGGGVTSKLYALSGGNPFYLEQLARAPPSGDAGATLGPGAAGIPAAVAAALAGELDALPGVARRVLEAAAVAGEPFEPELVADIADLGEDVTLAALDALLEVALIRPTVAPRRFAFRHPLVRHAVYAAAPAAWRLQAHARGADALERRGAAPLERAHHVEHAARRGDLAAVELLADAARAVFGQAPATAAGYLRSALRLLPDDPGSAPKRAGLLQLLTEALLGAGKLEAAHQVIGEALQLLPPQAWEPRGQLISLQTSIESWSGHPAEQSLRRLRATLAELPPNPSFAAFALRMPLAGIELFDLQLERVPAIATEALDDARRLGNPGAESAALSMLALAHAAAGRPDDAVEPLDRALALVADIDDADIGRHPQGFWTAGHALTYLDRYDEAISQLGRAVAIGHRTGHGYFLPVLLAYQLQPLIQLGRLTDAIALGEEALDAAWTGANPQLRLGAHRELALARHLSDDRESAEREAREAVRLAASEARLWKAKAGWTFGIIVADTQPAAGIATMLQAAGGHDLPEVVPAERPLVWAAIADAQLQRGDLDSAERTATRLNGAAATTQLPLARALAARTRAALLLAGGRADEAAEEASRAASTAMRATPLQAARLRAIEGTARARRGDRQDGVALLKQAADEFERSGAQRLRHEALRELRRLGVRTWRRGVTTPRDARGLDALSAREREVACLVLAGKRNSDIARELFLSLKTIESHTRNIYAKLGVTSRVELMARLAEDDREASARPTSTAPPDTDAKYLIRRPTPPSH